MKKITLLLIGLFSNCFLLSFAQGESPLPGTSTGQADVSVQQQTQASDYQSSSLNSNSAPLPGQAALNNQVVSEGIVHGNADKEELPVSVEGLKSLLEDTKDKALDSEHGEELVNKYLVWLDGLIRAHNKLAAAFGKQEHFEAACEAERDMSRHLYQIKDQFLYLKAQAMIKKNKWAEAIPILVDITAVEPQSSLGQAAYLCLKQAGFSPEAKKIISQTNSLNKQAGEKASSKSATPAKASMNRYLTVSSKTHKQ